jgi:choline dehydrogenase-like flavoprotein
MPEAERYDAVVIGTGQGGKPLAQALARAGRSVAIIERDRVAYLACRVAEQPLRGARAAGNDVTSGANK